MARARSLAEFQKSFPDEESCAAFLFKRRWPDGFVCPGCGKRRAVGLKSRPRLHECLDCGRQTSVTAGTTMHRSKLPLTTWFWAAHLMTTHSNGMSARQLEDQLGVTYKTAWLLTQKLRLAMIADNSAASIAAFVRANVKPGTTLLTDGHASYPGLSGYRPDPRVVGTMAGHVVLPWSHRAFSLLKRWALGTYHGLRRKHIDTYLNEFVFRYNRRFYRHVSFEALLGLATHHEPTGYWDIIKRDNPRKRAGRSLAPRLTTYRWA